MPHSWEICKRLPWKKPIFALKDFRKNLQTTQSPQHLNTVQERYYITLIHTCILYNLACSRETITPVLVYITLFCSVFHVNVRDNIPAYPQQFKSISLLCCQIIRRHCFHAAWTRFLLLLSITQSINNLIVLDITWLTQWHHAWGAYHDGACDDVQAAMTRFSKPGPVVTATIEQSILLKVPVLQQLPTRGTPGQWKVIRVTLLCRGTQHCQPVTTHCHAMHNTGSFSSYSHGVSLLQPQYSCRAVSAKTAE